MATLPAVDLGLIVDHLSAHEGVINKLKVYHELTSSIELRQILTLQINTMSTHVAVMLALMNPQSHQHVEVPDLPPHQINHHSLHGTGGGTGIHDKWIALEAHSTAKHMSNENYVSALMMKDSHVKNAHLEMAFQQFEIKREYDEFLNNRGWMFVPHGSAQDQVSAYHHFQHIFHS